MGAVVGLVSHLCAGVGLALTGCCLASFDKSFVAVASFAAVAPHTHLAVAPPLPFLGTVV